MALDGQRRRGPGADRHGQDRRVPGRVVQRGSRPRRRRTRRVNGAACAGARADARARGADPRRCRGARQVHLASRSGSRSAARITTNSARARSGRRRADRHARAHHRFLQAARVRPAPRAGARARRSRPDVRSRLHQGHPLTCCGGCPSAGPSLEHAVLGDAVASRARARLRAHERSGARAHRARQDDGRPRARRASISRRWRRRCRCCSRCCATATRTARWCSSTRAARPIELERRAAAQRYRAEALSGDVPQTQAAAHAAGLPGRQARGADRHRRRFARPACSGREPRLQLRPAAGPRGLRAPHRPHGARRRRGRRDQLRLRGLMRSRCPTSRRSSAARSPSRRSTTTRSFRSPRPSRAIGMRTAAKGPRHHRPQGGGGHRGPGGGGHRGGGGGGGIAALAAVVDATVADGVAAARAPAARRPAEGRAPTRALTRQPDSDPARLARTAAARRAARSS